MRRRLLFISATFAILAAFTGLWFGWRAHSCSQPHKKIAVTQQKPFVIIIPSYNNALYVEKNLLSVFSQRYDHYRVIYIDDNSTDGTLARVKEILEQLDQNKRTTLIHNETNVGALANLYKAIHSCSNEEIAVLLDGDDFLAHEEVLNTLNAAYADPSVWMTYGNYLDYPSYKQDPEICKQIPPRVIKNNSYRSYEWCASHLRSFYVGLFKEVKLSDLFYRGRCFTMASDLALMLPMLEMAGQHARFIPEVLYLYNRANPLSDHKINFAFQQECAEAVRSKKAYTELAELPLKPSAICETADLLIFSYNRPLQLYALLESIEKNITGIEQLTVIYRADPDYQTAYRELTARFPEVVWKVQNNPPHDFQDLCQSTIYAENSSPYILFAVDDMIVKEPINLKECIAAMEETKAYGFYMAHSLDLDTCYMYKRHQGIPPNLAIRSSIFAWQFSAGVDDWAYPNSVDMVLYRKKEIEKDFQKITFRNPFSLESNWALRGKKDRVGLFYATSKCVNLPINLVIISQNAHTGSYTTEELLEKYKQGLKIDITPFRTLVNRSRHVDAEIAFITRE